MKIIDSHVHFWNPDILEYPWLKKIPELNKSLLLEDYLDEVNNEFIEGCIFVQCDAIISQSVQEVRLIEEHCGDNEFIKGIVACAPIENGESVKPLLEEMADFKLLKGIRRLLQSEASEFCLQKEFIEGIKILKEYSLPFDICVNTLEQLENINILVGKNPENIFVLDHCGKPPIANNEIRCWAKIIKELSVNKNVFCKLSGLLTEMSPEQELVNLYPYIDCVFEAFGVERILYGGDWPVCRLGGGYLKWYRLLKEYTNNFSENEKHKMYFQNSVDVYKL